MYVEASEQLLYCVFCVMVTVYVLCVRCLCIWSELVLPFVAFCTKTNYLNSTVFYSNMNGTVPMKQLQ